VVACLLAAGLAACGASVRSTAESRIRSPRVQACETLIRELIALPVANMEEEALVVTITRAREHVEPCEQAFLDDAVTPTQTIFARHRARQVPMQVFYLESALSDRFRGREWFCEILSDHFQLLLEDIADIEAALGRPLPEVDARALVELRGLDLEAIEVLAQTVDRACP
jgi:hypothetical protein